jgi:DNA primase
MKDAQTWGVFVMGYLTDDFLRKLRNDININEVIGALCLETRRGTDLLRFHCPLCHGFHTATNPKTNLARCFDCKVNFNPIDLVMETTGSNFIDSVEFLKEQMNAPESER